MTYDYRVTPILEGIGDKGSVFVGPQLVGGSRGLFVCYNTSYYLRNDSPTSILSYNMVHLLLDDQTLINLRNVDGAALCLRTKLCFLRPTGYLHLPVR